MIQTARLIGAWNQHGIGSLLKFVPREQQSSLIKHITWKFPFKRGKSLGYIRGNVSRCAKWTKDKPKMFSMTMLLKDSPYLFYLTIPI